MTPSMPAVATVRDVSGFALMAAIATALQVALLALNWASLPPEIPIHFDVSGNVDATGSKLVLLHFPATSVFLLACLLFVRTRPQFINIPWRITPENAARQYRLAFLFTGWIIVVATAMLTHLEWQTIRVAHGQAQGLPASFGPIMLAILLVSAAPFAWLGWKRR